MDIYENFEKGGITLDPLTRIYKIMLCTSTTYRDHV